MTPAYKKPEVSMTKLLHQVPNKFLLCVAASRRARQLKDIIHNEGILEEVPSVPVLDALKEIMDGKISVTLKSIQEEAPQAGVESAKGTPATEVSESAEADDKKSPKEAKSKSKNKSLAA
jgi:DNA-directed RNA polymerase omega subunit